MLTLRRRPLPSHGLLLGLVGTLLPAALDPASAAPGAAREPTRQTVTSQHAVVEYSGQLGIANTLAATVDQVWPDMVAFFTPLGLTDVSPAQIELTSGVPGGEPGRTDHYAPYVILINPDNPDLIDGQPAYRTTLVHELFHLFSYRAGVVTPADLDADARNHWLLEGTAELAEHRFLPSHSHKKSRFQNYIHRTARHGVSLLDTDHYAALFLYYLWKDQGRSSLPFDLMDYFRTWRDGPAIAQNMNLGSYWKDFTQRMWNKAPATQVLVDGAPVRTSGGAPIQPDFSEAGLTRQVPASGTVAVAVELPPLSWRHFMFDIPATNDFASFYLGSLVGQPGFIAHAYLKDAASGNWSYEDWTGLPHRRICLQQKGVCGNATIESISRVALILANSDLLTGLSDKVAAGALADRWRLTEVQVSANKTVPATGELTLEFGTGGGLLIRTDGFWLVFPESDFAGQSRLAYNYINRSCRMKGFVKFRRSNEQATYETAEQRDKLTWDAARVDVGGLIDTPSGWWCEFSRELLAGAAGGGLAGGGSVAAVFTRLNTREYPPGSFAHDLSAVMKAVLSLQVPASGSKQLVMHQKTQGDRVVLQVELQGNVRAFFEPYPS